MLQELYHGRLNLSRLNYGVISLLPKIKDDVGTSPTFSLWAEEKGGLARRVLYHERSTEVNPLQIWNMDSGNITELGPHRFEWISLSTEVNLCLLGERIASSKFYLGRTWISITMKFINENEVVNGRVTVILFLVCVPKRSNLSSCFEVSRKGRGNR